MKDSRCPFCTVDPKLLIEETQYSIVLLNLHQVARGDAVLIVPKTHVKSISDLSDLEYQDFCACIKRVHGRLLQAGETKFTILINE